TALPDGMLGAGRRGEAASLKAAGKDVAADLRCYAKEAAKGESVDGPRTAKAQARFVAAFDRTAGCTADGHAGEIERDIASQCVDTLDALSSRLVTDTLCGCGTTAGCGAVATAPESSRHCRLRPRRTASRPSSHDRAFLPTANEVTGNLAHPAERSRRAPERHERAIWRVLARGHRGRRIRPEGPAHSHCRSVRARDPLGAPVAHVRSHASARLVERRGRLDGRISAESFALREERAISLSVRAAPQRRGGHQDLPRSIRGRKRAWPAGSVHRGAAARFLLDRRRLPDPAP